MYYLFLLLIICQNTFAEEIKPLPQGDTWRKYIALSLRDEEGLEDGLFNPVSDPHLRAPEPGAKFVFRLLLSKKKTN
ncbi:hypothetical protein C4813_24220 [Salmonella enterica subsp. enterica serovar Rubislaw]|nr:hypothetical protein C4813_24220 [Salmonella enterica subsp. enterica serovar Rubislaw]